MIHLIRGKKKKFDLVSEIRGNTVWMTPTQGYETKQGCHKVIKGIIRQIMKENDVKNIKMSIQDDTLTPPAIYDIYYDHIEKTDKKPIKNYEINKRR